MPHREECPCPACRYRRGEGKGQSARLSVRLDVATHDRIRNHPKGARGYLEVLVKEEGNLRGKLYVEHLLNSQNVSAIKELERHVQRLQTQNQRYAEALRQIAAGGGHPGAVAAQVLQP